MGASLSNVDVIDNNSTFSIAPNETNAGVNLTRGERVFFAVLFLIMAAVSVIGNALVCLTFRKIKLQASDLLTNLAIGDIALGAVVMTSCAVTLLKEEWVFGQVTCNIVGFVKATSIFSSNISLCVISADRYIFIKRISFSAKVHKRINLLFLLSPWVISTLSALGPLLGWGQFLWTPTIPVCTIDWLHSPSYTIVCFAGYGFIPQIILLGTYVQIFRYVRENKMRLLERTKPDRPRVRNISDANSSTTDEPNGLLSRVAISREEISLLKTTVVIVVVFTVAAIPYVIQQLVSLQRNQGFSLRTSTIGIVFVFFGSCLNPFIYSGGNKKFRYALKKTVSGLMKCRKPNAVGQQPVR